MESRHKVAISRKELISDGKIFKDSPKHLELFYHTEAKATFHYYTDRTAITVIQEGEASQLSLKYAQNARTNQSCHCGPCTVTYASKTPSSQMVIPVSILTLINHTLIRFN